MFLAGRLGLCFTDRLDRLGGEEDRAVSVGFEVDTDVVASGGMMQVLDAGGRTFDWELEDVGDVFGSGPVGVGGLDYADFEFAVDASDAGHVGEEGGA